MVGNLSRLKFLENREHRKLTDNEATTAEGELREKDV